LFDNKLRLFRERAQLSQQDLADKTQVPRSWIQRKEQFGKRITARIPYMKSIAEYFGVTMEEIFPIASNGNETKH
jgi:transcriptional regulator with XRE-family HTH domain